MKQTYMKIYIISMEIVKESNMIFLSKLVLKI